MARTNHKAEAPLGKDREFDQAFGRRTRSNDAKRVCGPTLPQHQPSPKVIRNQKHNEYELERLVLDLNGEEPVPAGTSVIPDKRQAAGLALHSLARWC